MGKKKQSAVSEIQPLENKQSAKHGFLLLRLILGLAVVMIYLQAIRFDFTYDDDIFYVKHGSVQKGLAGFGEFFSYGSMNKFDGSVGVQPYRPVTLIAFAIQKELFYGASDPIDEKDEDQLNDLAHKAHFINILLYVLIAQVLFTLLIRLFSSLGPLYAMLMAALFVAHPLHTEVVASVKSMDELLAALFGFMTWHFLITRKPEEIDNIKTIGIGSMLFFLSLFSKESAIAFIIIIPLSAFMIMRKDLGYCLKQMIPLVLVTICFLLLRHNALGPGEGSEMTRLDNVIMAANGLGEQLATKAMILFNYLKLVIIPWPLRYDYSFNQLPAVGWRSVEAIAGLVLYASLFVYAIINFKKGAVLSFSILFFFLTSAPTNNLFFLNGATLAERFLFVPSLAMCMGVVYLIGNFSALGPKQGTGANDKKRLLVITVLIVLFALLSFSRTRNWASELALFEQGAKESPNSSRANYNLASLYMKLSPKAENPADKKEYLNLAKEYFLKSLVIFPESKEGNYNLAICYEMMEEMNNSTEQYKKAIAAAPLDVRPPTRLGDLYFKLQRQDSARKYFELAYALDSNNRISIQKMEMIYCEKGLAFNRIAQNDSAIYYLKKGLYFNPGNEITLLNLAKISRVQMQNGEALSYIKEALRINPSNIRIVEFAGQLYNLNKDYTKAIEVANQGLRLDTSNKTCLIVLLEAYNAIGNTNEANRIGELLNANK